MSFDAFNLLVGVSGAGKTKIVEALKRVCAATLRSGEAPLTAPGLWLSSMRT